MLILSGGYSRGVLARFTYRTKAGLFRFTSNFDFSIAPDFLKFQETQKRILLFDLIVHLFILKELSARAKLIG